MSPEQMHRRFVTSEEMEVEELPWGPHEWLCRPSLTDAKNLLLVRVRMPPGEGHAFHRHPAMEEIIYVISGRAEQWVDRESRILGPGDTAHIPVDVVHGTYNAGEEPLVFLAILSPATFEGPALVDVSDEAPWVELRGGGPGAGALPGAPDGRASSSSGAPSSSGAAPASGDAPPSGGAAHPSSGAAPPPGDAHR